MKAELLYALELDLDDRLTVEVVIWSVPKPLRGSTHLFKYRLALVSEGECVLRYDNEAGKGDHLHLGKREYDYEFKSTDDLQVDFWSDVYQWQQKHPAK